MFGFGLVPWAMSDVRRAIATKLAIWQAAAASGRLQLSHDELSAFQRWSREAKRKGVLARGLA